MIAGREDDRTGPKEYVLWMHSKGERERQRYRGREKHTHIKRKRERV